MSRGPNPNLKKADISKTPFLFMQADPVDYYEAARSSLNGTQEQTILSTVFFSPQNINLIQKQIIKTVLMKTDYKYLIEKQSEEDLLVVMRSIFIQSARHAPDNIRCQIKELNDLVVDDIVPGIVTAVKWNVGYKQKIFGPMEVMKPPQNVNKTKTLPNYFNM